MKSHTRLLVSLLVISMVASATACSKITKNKEGIGEITELVSEMPIISMSDIIEPIVPIEENREVNEIVTH